MAFEELYESYQRNELLLIDGGFCNWHLRKDGQLTIKEIISTKKGAGTEIINILSKTKNAISLFAKCPADLSSNMFYKKMGFIFEGEEFTPKGRKLNLWRKLLIQN
jgi:hypothetical protein